MPTVRKRGTSWQAMVRIKSRGTIVHQETRTFPTEPLARSWAQGVETRIKQVGVPGRRLQTMTMGELIEAYTDHLCGVRPLRRSLEHELGFLAGRLRSLKLSGLTSEPFVKFALERHKEGAGPATVLHNLSLLRSALGAAKPVFDLDVTPAPVIDAIKAVSRIGVAAKSRSVEVRVSDEVIARLVAEFQRIAGNPCTLIPMAQIVQLALLFPRRRSELCKMLWVNWNPKAQTVLLLDTKDPSKVRDELVPVPTPAARIINTLPRLDERILPYNPESVSTAFERACERLGILGVRFHDLRHEGITRLFEQGLDIPEVALISGHTSWATLRRYTHLKPAAVLEKLDAKHKTAHATQRA